MNERTHNFLKLKLFENCDNDSIEIIFADIFCEFINELNESDLSEKTLDNLNGIFEKDMKIFFEKSSNNHTFIKYPLSHYSIKKI